MKKLYGLLGHRLIHSFSPKIHSMIFEKLNLKGYYHLFEVENKDIKDAILGFKALKVKGINVTIPYKIISMDYLNEISKEAKDIGAINTICFKEGKTIGYNTDYFGFGMMLNKFNINLIDKNVVILGSGGASKAVVQYLLDNKVNSIVIVSRNKEKTMEHFKNLKVISYDELKNLDNRDILINATPCGMYPNVNESPISKEEVLKFNTVVDLIYNPKDTLLMRYAMENNIKAINGLYMLVGQAVKSQELWNNRIISTCIIDEIYEKALKIF